ncbi:MAG: SUMF1/EgtB/PvdO family nonheme iron enzyme [Caldilineaceae bacterium]|nr:SUMF1/EgtB/PvdO family nonheme iron enzyme [Caldilineaceae bacterium]
MATIVFFASNPAETSPLQLDEEIREVMTKIRGSQFREMLQVVPMLAARPDDLLQGLNEHKPDVVHFSGHGSSRGELLLMDSQRRAQPVSPVAIRALFAAFSPAIKLVFLNACFAATQADAFKDVVGCVVGMESTVSDQASIAFASSFYRAVGFGASVQEAFDQGVAAILLEGLDEAQMPKLLAGQNVDPASMRLVSPVTAGSIHPVAPADLPAKAGDVWTNPIGMTFALIPPGTFLMGADDPTFPDQRPQHPVILSQPFHLLTTTVTQQQWSDVMGAKPWQGNADVREGPNYPAVYISWDDAQRFLARLNAQAEGSYYRLPSEAEWEYAARAGSNGLFSFGSDERALNTFGWYDGNAANAGENHAHEVAGKRANPWGLFDMHGNVWEWVEDWYGGYPETTLTDPTGPQTGTSKVLRGGAFDFAPIGASSAYRNHNSVNRAYPVIGFRIVRVDL